jgi:signal transduction histidine kinase
MRPLDRVGSIKLKLGIAIVTAVGVAAVTSTVGLRLGVPVWVRPVVAVAISLAMIQVLARGMTSPLREMARAASAMAAGDYGLRVTATSRDEVGDLARAFNSMAAQLAETDRQRHELIANVSHELRTPLSALQATLENVVDGVATRDDLAFEAMLAQTQRLGRLVSQLLDLSRLESGATARAVAPVDVAAVLDDVATEAGISHPHVDVVVDIGQANGLTIRGDAERLHQVVANLVDNAARYGPDGHPVDVRARSGPERVAIEVADQGPGIPDDELTRVFERFHRTDEARSADAGGTGLGLAIARWIVELHHGSIRATHNDPTGCRMVVELPRTAR